MFQFPWYASCQPMDSVGSDCPLRQPGFPIRTSPDQSLLTAPRGRFVVRHVLHRLLVPRHPPCALISLTYSSLISVCAAFRSCSSNLSKLETNPQKPLPSRTNFAGKSKTQLKDVLHCSYPVFKVQWMLRFPYRKLAPLGDALLSRDPAVQVPSALEGLTVVFGMGTRGSPPPSPPNGIFG
jgi:hypothetical protein